MGIIHLARRVFKVFYSVTEVLVWIAYVGLAAMVLIVFIDVCGRYFLDRPLRGSYELVLLAMSILGGFSIMYTTVKRGHASIDLVVRRFSRRNQIVMQRVASLVGLGTWAALAYWVVLNALGPSGEAVSHILGLPVGPFWLILAAAIFLCCLALLIQTFHPEASEEIPEEVGGKSQNES